MVSVRVTAAAAAESRETSVEDPRLWVNLAVQLPNACSQTIRTGLTRTGPDTELKTDRSIVTVDQINK